MPSAFVDNDLFIDFEQPDSLYDSSGVLLTKDQVDFFLNSKCLNENGKLLVVYHASPNKFTTFDSTHWGSCGGSIYGNGFYFSDSNYGLDTYGKYINKYYLNLQKPFIWKEADTANNLASFIKVLETNNFVISNELRKQLADDILNNDGGLDTLIEQTCGTGLAHKYFSRAGFDGIMNLEIGDYVAFSSDQIKLCSNKTPTKSSDAAA